jgi:glutamine synthetase
MLGNPDPGGPRLPPGIDVVRVLYADLAGTDRGRDVLAHAFAGVAETGLGFCRAVYSTSPQGDVTLTADGIRAGGPSITLRPHPGKVHPLPWEPGVAWCLADAHTPAGEPCADSPRQALRRVIARWHELGLTPIVGPELEFHLLVRDEGAASGWAPYADGQGNIYATGRRGDPKGHLLPTLRALHELDLGVTAANHEFGGGQFEVNLRHSDALDAADRAFLLKCAVQELARRDGLRATFMAKPFHGASGSGFHTHLSCLDEAGNNVFADPDSPDGLSQTALSATAGILTRAPALAALANPTINSYKRLKPHTLAPWLIDWGLDNRTALVRVPPGRALDTRLEVRLPDASSNPYIAIAGVLATALLGITDKLEPPPPLHGYGYDAAVSTPLPSWLTYALDALEADEALTELLSPAFVAAYLACKRDEVARFECHVTDWEFREYAGPV